MAKQTLDVAGMHCASCGMLIDETLEDLPGVRRASTSVRRGRTKIDFDPEVARLDDLVSTIEKLGYKVSSR